MKVVKPPMDLKQFMQSRKVLKLYRDIMKLIRTIPDENDKKQLSDWARNDFKTYKDVTDHLHIKFLIDHGEKSLQELQKNLGRLH